MHQMLTDDLIADQTFQNEVLVSVKREFSVHAKRHFKFLSQFREVLNAFECFLMQVQTHLRINPAMSENNNILFLLNHMITIYVIIDGSRICAIIDRSRVSFLHDL